MLCIVILAFVACGPLDILQRYSHGPCADRFAHLSVNQLIYSHKNTKHQKSTERITTAKSERLWTNNVTTDKTNVCIGK